MWGLGVQEPIEEIGVLVFPLALKLTSPPNLRSVQNWR
jgi:hypothetical protein